MKTINLPELDSQQLERQLDQTKVRVFIGKNAAFMAPLMCTQRFEWSTAIPTAATNGVSMIWNPYYMHYLTPEARESIMVHELRHVAYLHPIRRGNRDPKIWNMACDTVLDNQMDYEGYVVDNRLFPPELGFPPDAKTFVNHKYDDWSAEQIYDDFIANAVKVPTWYAAMGMGDLQEPKENDQAMKYAVINNVVMATNAASLAGAKPGDIPGEVQQIIDKFLKPKLPWNQILYNFFNELSEQDYTWARPNRRYQDMYLPSLQDEYEGLDHIILYEDVSGSVTDQQVLRFNSEFKHIKETFNPRKITLVLFDTKIQKEYVFYQDDPFDELVVVGRGGTSLKPVRQHIIDNRPSGVVIFSDLECRPMEPLPTSLNVPIIWVAINNQAATVPCGKLIHIEE